MSAMCRMIAVLLLCWVGPAWCQEWKLIPLPRSLKPGQGSVTLHSPVRVRVSSAEPEDRFAAETLIEDLKAVHGLQAIVSTRGTADIWIGRVGSPEVDREIGRLGLEWSALENEESYVLGASGSVVLVAAKTAEGVFYGVQTLRQLVGPAGRVPAVAIADWPALRYRGLSVDVSRGPILTEEQMKALIRGAAEYKLNLLSFYMEHVFPYTHAPLVAPTGGEITPELIERLIAYARPYHVMLLPQQQTFGHLHHMLKLERYAGMAETPHGSVLAPEDERGYQWIRQTAGQLAQLFPSPFLHIGSDETFELGRGRSRAAAEREGVGEIYLAHMRKVTEMLRPLGKKLMFWGDIALKHPDLIPKLPKELIAMTWVYSPKENFSSDILPFRDNGMEVFVCPGISNWNRIFPNFSHALVNINNFVRDGKKLGARGMLNTHWGDDGEALFNMTWYGVVFSAAAAWQSDQVDVAAFDHSFDWAFYRNQDDTLVKVIRRLDQVHGALLSAGVGDASDSLFWIDPFSRQGSETVRKAGPAASQVRLLAEGALVDLQVAGARARTHRETLPFLEFAARRLDGLGMKIQFSKEIGDLYRAATAAQADSAAVRENLGRINSVNGLIQDLRDSTIELKSMYRTAWLAENRSYWLDNVLLRYDAEALYWLGKSRLLTAAAREYAATGVLPTPDALGLVLP
jgi:hexosaminidase